MRIRRLDIVGFKSFMDKTVVAFDDGVTGVVGPNGCGKSNVADAIRWVLGEQSARQLRGRSMEDVIFNGSESKPPLSMAEVVLTFENDRPSELPTQFQGYSEITVGRRLFRTGESEYLVNGVQARLLDVNDIFFGSGIGRTAYSIIEQGRIGQIVSARPEDRRAIVEEAAGITKYKKRREAAERKMEATQQNLTRVADIVQELGKQLESLNRQARKAEKYKALKAQIRELELRAAAARYLEITATRRAAEERHATLRAEEVELAARVAELDAALEQDRARLGEGEARLGELSGREHEHESALRVSEVSQEAAAREVEQIAERTRAQAAEVEALKDQAEALLREREALLRQRDELVSLVASDEGRLADAEVALREAAREQGSLQSDADGARATAAAAQSEASAHTSQLAQLDRQRQDVRARLQKFRDEADDLAASAGQLDGSRSRHVEKLGQTRQLKLRLDEQRGAQEDLLERTRAEFIQNEAKLITLREELAEKRSRLGSLLEIVRNYEGYGRGVRSLMTRAGQGETRESGVFGLVADVVSTPAEYETAIEAVLGERLQYVIVESHSQGVEAIDYLKTAAAGRARQPPGHRGPLPRRGPVRPVLRQGGPLPARRRAHRARPPRRPRDLAGAGGPAHARDARRRGARPVRRRHRRPARGRGTRRAAAPARGAGARGDGPRLRGGVRARDGAPPDAAGPPAPARGGAQGARPRRPREGARPPRAGEGPRARRGGARARRRANGAARGGARPARGGARGAVARGGGAPARGGHRRGGAGARRGARARGGGAPRDDEGPRRRAHRGAHEPEGEGGGGRGAARVVRRRAPPHRRRAPRGGGPARPALRRALRGERARRRAARPHRGHEPRPRPPRPGPRPGARGARARPRGPRGARRRLARARRRGARGAHARRGRPRRRGRGVAHGARAVARALAPRGADPRAVPGGAQVGGGAVPPRATAV